ncbi:MAG: hypothetical protein QOI34_903 [Verrucomicrobiota bacterium]|jgi:hypothetical protein
MKRIISSTILGLCALLIASGSAQTPSGKEDQKLLALVKDVQTQQAQIAENQTKIESKLAEVAEAVRVARIYAGRGGK